MLAVSRGAPPLEREIGEETGLLLKEQGNGYSITAITLWQYPFLQTSHSTEDTAKRCQNRSRTSHTAITPVPADNRS